MKLICLLTGNEAPIGKKCESGFACDDVCYTGCGILTNPDIEITAEESVNFGKELFKVMNEWHSELPDRELTEEEIYDHESLLHSKLGTLALYYGTLWKKRREQKQFRKDNDLTDDEGLMV